MAGQFFTFPPGFAVSTNPSVGNNSAAIPSESTLVGGKSPTSTLLPLSVDASGNLNVNLISSTPTLSENIAQIVGAVPSATNSLPVQITDGTAFLDPRQIRALTNADVVTAELNTANGSAINFGQSLSVSSLPVVIASDQSAIPISASSLPLPTGAATAANQTTGNASLSSIDGKLTDTANGLKVDGSAVTQPISAASLPLPTGAATSANQTTANTSLASIDTKTPALGQALSAASVPVVLASDQSSIPVSQGANTNGSQVTGSATTTASTITAPANAVGFILQATETNTDNMRWRAGSVATSATGQKLLPGADTGYLPMSKDISIIAVSGTQEYNIQWVLSS